MACALDGYGQLTLMTSAGAGYTAGNDLSAFGKVLTQTGNILVVDFLNSIYTESANLSAGLSATGTIISFQGRNLLTSYIQCD